jgi:filamentous hemagglutinin family protein
LLFESTRWIAAVVACSACLLPSFAVLAQTGSAAQVRAGDVRFESAAGTIRITQQSQRSIIEWPSFAIANGQRMEYALPGSSAISLNRVTSQNAARIDGELISNGQVWLISPSGVLIGPSGRVSTHGFLASTLEIADQTFLQGQYRLNAGGRPGRIDHQGVIQSLDGGYVILAGAGVRSSGLIEARLGEVVIASARTLTLDLAGDRLLSFAVDGALVPADSGDPAIDIPGQIHANGGRVTLSARAANDVVRGVINLSGVVEAGRAIERQGEIVLEAGPTGSARIDGQIVTNGRFEKRGGGTLRVAGSLEIDGLLDLIQGRIERAPGGRVGSSLTATALAEGTVLDLSESLSAGERLVLGAPTGAGTMALGGHRLELHVDGVNSHFAGTLTGAGARLYKYGDGTLTLTGTSTYSGGTWVVDGRIRLGGPNRGAPPGTPGPIGTGLLYADLSDDARGAWERALARELAQAAERARLAAEALAAQRELPSGPTILPERAADALVASQSVGGATAALSPSGPATSPTTSPSTGSEAAASVPATSTTLTGSSSAAASTISTDGSSMALNTVATATSGPTASPLPVDKPPTPRDAADAGDRTLQAATPPPPARPATQSVRAALQTVTISPGLVSAQRPVPVRPSAGSLLDQRLPGTGNASRW